MDKSEQYIKMCNCPEIQDGWQPKEQDFVIALGSYNLRQHWKDHINSSTYIKGVVSNDVFLGFGPWADKKDCIYLPQQDQLQSMVWGSDFTSWGLAISFHNWLVSAKSKEFDDTSMEQLWLAFVMWELHQKRWDGKTWTT